MLKIILFFLSCSLLLITCKTTVSETQESDPSIQSLPFLGQHDVENGDTLYYQVPKFSFINQNGEEISHQQYFGKIYVADFFFTTCPTICPVMSSQMVRLQTLIKNAGLQDSIMFLSHTVDPIHDNSQVLLEYSQKIGADEYNWNFVTKYSVLLSDLYDLFTQYAFYTAFR